MTYAEGVPVTIAGAKVGSARVNEDGSIEMTLGGSLLGKEILMHLQVGNAEGLSVAPVMIPALPRTPREASEDVLPQHLGLHTYNPDGPVNRGRHFRYP
jgi:hypothetical protein